MTLRDTPRGKPTRFSWQAPIISKTLLKTIENYWKMVYIISIKANTPITTEEKLCQKLQLASVLRME